MKLNATPSIHDIADAIRQKLSELDGLSTYDVQVGNNVIKVAAPSVPNGLKSRVQSIVSSYFDCGYGLVLNTRNDA